MIIEINNDKIKLINLNKINYFLNINIINKELYITLLNTITKYNKLQKNILNNLIKFENKNILKIYNFNNNIIKEPNFIILSSGQSNMGGYSSYYEKNNFFDQCDENIYSFNIDNNKWEIADLNNYSLGDKKYCKMIGNNSIPFQFAKNLRLKYPYIIPGIINICDGAETIALWAYLNENDQYYNEYKRTLHYRNGIKKNKGYGGIIFDRIKKIYNNSILRLNNKFSKKIDVVLWHQGESDYIEKSNMEYFNYAYLKVIDQFNELNKYNLTPFIAGTLLNNKKISKINRPYNQIFNKIIRNKNNKYLYNYAELSDLESDKDNFHFITKSTRKAGKLYFEAYEELINKIRNEGIQ